MFRGRLVGTVAHHDVFIGIRRPKNTDEEHNQETYRQPTIPFAVVAQGSLLTFYGTCHFIDFPNLYHDDSDQENAKEYD